VAPPPEEPEEEDAMSRVITSRSMLATAAGLSALLAGAWVAGCTTGPERIPPPPDGGTPPATDSGMNGPDCENGIRDGDESSVDCGGSCDPCSNGARCTVGTDCTSGVCSRGYCLVPSCSDGVRNQDEIGVDCGGDCGLCPGGEPCTQPSDCVSNRCTMGTCEPSSCEDGRMNGDETGEDCGGDTCPACPGGETCLMNEDCLSLLCVGGECTEPACNDHVQNQDETSVDCGGETCPPCRNGLACLVDADCEGMRCFEGGCVACDDGIRNAEETDVDCGGDLCEACADGSTCAMDSDCASDNCLDGVCVSCEDGIQNDDESDVDCGGATCPGCDTGETCGGDSDCMSNICDGGTCNAPGCGDGVLNGAETDLDCGGGDCAPCAVGDDCLLGRDCVHGVCGSGGTCESPTCTDGVANGDETDVDCGGPGSCPRCPDYRVCTSPSDCVSDMCTMGRCGDTGCIPFPGTATDAYGYFGCSIPMSPSTLPCPDISTTGTLISLSDDSNQTVPIGFSFDYYGTSYTNVDVQSNGGISFDSGYMTLSNSCPISGWSGTPSNLIATYWDDLDPGNPGGEVRYETVGSAPNRQFVVWWSTERFSSTPNHAQFSVVLHEGSNHIQVCYHDANFGSSTYDGGASATSGIIGSGGSLQFSCNTASLTDGLLLEYRHP
jgi:hypothetical protein